MHSFKYLEYARNYLEAAKVVGASNLHGILPEVSLFVHSIELGLKCYLKLEGFSSEFLRYKIGHDLAKALELATDRGLKLDKDFEEEIRHLSPMHKKRTFTYMEESMISIPVTKQIIPLIEDFLDGLEESCRQQIVLAMSGKPAK